MFDSSNTGWMEVIPARGLPQRRPPRGLLGRLPKDRLPQLARKGWRGEANRSGREALAEQAQVRNRPIQAGAPGHAAGSLSTMGGGSDANGFAALTGRLGGDSTEIEHTRRRFPLPCFS